MLKKIIVFLCSVIIYTSVAIPAGVANSTHISENTKVTVESAINETFSDTANETGQFVKTGYKHINSITEITTDQAGLPVNISMKVIEDYYDLNGKYIETKVFMEEGRNNFKTGKAKVKSKEKKYNTPLATTTGYDIPTNTKAEKN